MNFANYKDRLVRAARLDPQLYEEVEADRKLMPQAMITVVLASVAAGIGGISKAGVAGLVFGSISALAGWFVWAYLTYFIGGRLLPEKQTVTDPGELLRTTGFSSAPGLVRIIGIIPGLAIIVNLLAAVWMLAAMVVAVRQALDYQSTWRAIVVCIIGWIVQTTLILVVLYFFGVPRQ